MNTFKCEKHGLQPRAYCQSCATDEERLFQVQLSMCVTDPRLRTESFRLVDRYDFNWLIGLAETAIEAKKVK